MILSRKIVFLLWDMNEFPFAHSVILEHQNRHFGIDYCPVDSVLKLLLELFRSEWRRFVFHLIAECHCGHWNISAGWIMHDCTTNFNPSTRVDWMGIESNCLLFLSAFWASVSLAKRCLTVMDDAEEVAGIGTERHIPLFYKRDKYRRRKT